MLIDMKYIYTLISLFLITGCVKRNQVEFEGTTPGIKNGVFIIKTTGDSTIYGENIKDGKFAVKQKQLKYPDYYLMAITDNDRLENNAPFEVYLEDGKYTIQTDANKRYKYPKISSPSKIQDQLSAYYTLKDSLVDNILDESQKLKEEIRLKGASLSKDALVALLNKSTETDSKINSVNTAVITQFVKKYPASEISAHLMAKLSYEDDPQAYYNIYKRFSPAAKNTDEGKELGEKLSRLVKLVPGAKAPVIAGKTPDGKLFDQKTINNKVILVDFWRADNELSRTNHQKLIDFLGGFKDHKKFGIVSVSIDTKNDWWISAIGGDHLTWTQVSDLKGDDSPNAANWSITRIPTYYLVNGDWNIIERDLDINNLDFEVNDYLKHHK